jgi:sterol desaturase/sphingolipid hydroxylase (fatty acid hydroxylase superfamily)
LAFLFDLFFCSVSTAYIEDRDAAIQSVLPLLLSALIVRPHPITFAAYLFFHLSNNAWNHSGLDSLFVRVLSLKFLPLRCANTLHDAHHRFSGFKTGKNYGEMFWLWDWVFGTLTRTESLSRGQTVKE